MWMCWVYLGAYKGGLQSRDDRTVRQKELGSQALRGFCISPAYAQSLSSVPAVEPDPHESGHGRGLMVSSWRGSTFFVRGSKGRSLSFYCCPEGAPHILVHICAPGPFLHSVMTVFPSKFSTSEPPLRLTQHSTCRQERVTFLSEHKFWGALKNCVLYIDLRIGNHLFPCI